MSETIEWTGQGGTVNGTVTAGNSGGASGPAFNNVTGAATYAVVPGSSNLGIYFNLTSTKWRAYHSWGTATSQVAGKFYVTPKATPVSYLTVFSFVDTAYSGASVIQLDTSGKLVVLNRTAGKLFTSTDVLANDARYRVEFQFDVGSTTSNGTFNVQYFLGESSTAIGTLTNTATNTGSGTQISRMQVGNYETTSPNVIIDGLKYVSGSMVPVGPAGAPPAAVVNVVAVTANPDSWTLVGSASTEALALSDADTTTYVESPDNPVASPDTFRLGRLTAAPGYVNGLVQADSTAQTIKVELLQGATVRASTAAAALTTGWASYELTLTGTEQSNIATSGDGSVADLDVRFTANTP